MSDTEAAIVFENQREALLRLAYRMLGVVSDAQDAVQETWLRWAATDRAKVREPRSWLLRTCSRWCLDHLKSARVQREVYPGPWLPEPLVLDVAVTEDNGARRLELDEAVSMALLTAMERLTPTERAALLLHDVFDHDYAEVAEALGRNEAACRKLVSRARARVQEERATVRADAITADDHRRLLGAFLDAAAVGDTAALKAVLCDDVAFHSDGGGKVVAAGKVVFGAALVAKFFTNLVRKFGARYDESMLRWVWFNGAPGVVVLDAPGGQPVTAFSIAIRDGRIGGLYALRNPDKLAGLALSRRAGLPSG